MIALIFVLLTAGCFLLYAGYKFMRGEKKLKARAAGGVKKNESAAKTVGADEPANKANAEACPLCATPLTRGARLKSVVPAAPSSGDRLCRVIGCPACLSGEKTRSCPVCGAEVPADSYLIARLFERSPQKTHIHILGCKRCRSSRR